MRRRRFLAAVTVAATLPLAGCSDPRGSLRLTDVSDDTALAERRAQSADDLPPPYRELVAGAVAGDPDRATVTDTHPPFDPTHPVEYEGSYYAVDYEATNERTETQYSIELTVNPDERPERTVAFLDLPAVDQERLVEVTDPERSFDDGESVGTAARYTDATAAESVIVPEPEYDGVTRADTFAVAVTGSRGVTVADYRYRADLVAEDATGLATRTRNRFRFAFDGLPPEQRSILDEAKGGEAESEDPPSEAFAGLVERFREHPAIEEERESGTWLLRDGGTDWWAELRLPESMREG